jgi:hypothetical protein
MRPGSRLPADLKAECLLRIAKALVDEARKVLLANCVETYSHLDAHEQQRFEQIVERQDYNEVRVMRSVYEIQGEKRGTLQGMRDAALLQLREKFGELPDRAEARVRSMESTAELESLLRAILRANSLAELDLADERSR